jgi:hypothetical protein
VSRHDAGGGSVGPHDADYSVVTGGSKGFSVDGDGAEGTGRQGPFVVSGSVVEGEDAQGAVGAHGCDDLTACCDGRSGSLVGGDVEEEVPFFGTEDAEVSIGAGGDDAVIGGSEGEDVGREVEGAFGFFGEVVVEGEVAGGTDAYAGDGEGSRGDREGANFFEVTYGLHRVIPSPRGLCLAG